ncbi:MAG: tetratricopeptide repeat protein, partial [Candidatus Scalindua sp.]
MNNTLNEGETLFADGKIEEAEKCFLSLVENDLECKEAYNNLGVIAFQKDDKEKAIDYFTRALEIDP